MNLSRAFIDRVGNTFGEDGRKLLADLPALIDEASHRWGLENVTPLGNLSYNFVAFADRPAAGQVVLKIGVPDRELASEMAALKFYDGRGAARLIEADPARGMLLLERLVPGTLLATVSRRARAGGMAHGRRDAARLVEEDDDRATVIAADVMERIWRPAPEADSPFLTVEYWAQALPRLRNRFEGGTGPLPRPLFEQAELLFAELLPSQTRRVLLHGDLHHENILLSQRGWLAIDPKGVIGEPEYEAGALLRNPLDLPDRPDPVKRTERRIAILCERLGLDRGRVRAWAIAQAVLSACWHIEDHTGGEAYDIACAEIYARVRI